MEYKHKILTNDKNLTEVEVTVDYKDLDIYKEEAFEVLSKDVKITGFRPGKAPKEMIEAKLGSKLLSEAIGRLMIKVAYEMIVKEEFKPIKQPEYELIKLDKDEGIIFKASFTNYPKVELGDFSKIKVKKEEVKVTEEDIDTVIKSMIRSNVKPEKIKELTKIIDNNETEKNENSDNKEKDSKDKSTKEPKEEVKPLDFELNDALISELGYEEEKTLESLRNTVKNRLSEIRTKQAEEEYVDNIVKEAVKLSVFEIPDLFIDQDVNASESSFTRRLQELNLSIDTYLGAQGKTLESLREEWKKQAVDRISIDLVLINIAQQNEETPTEEDVDKEIALISEPSLKLQYDSEAGRDYIKTVLTRRKGIDRLLKEVEGEGK